MNKLILYITLFLLPIISQAKSNPLVGEWRENEEKTLVSLRSTKSLSKEEVELFSEDWFGHLTVEYTEKIKIHKLDSVLDPKDNNLSVEYKFILENSKYYLIEVFNSNGCEKSTPIKLFKDNDCYYTIYSKWKFRVYYCKI